MDEAPVTLDEVSRPLTLRGRTLRARVYLPAHQPGLADDGMPGPRYIDYHRERAKAGLGMQITGATPVLWSEVWADGRTLVNIDDRIIPGYRNLARAVHEEGGLMLAQLAHVGAMETAGDAIVSASWEHSELTQRMSREATAEELADIAGLYRAAAGRCREGDLDGVEVTMAHGMLLASFLSPLMNRRQDGFGGDRDGRTSFPRQVLAAVREAIGEDRIVGIRIPGDEMVAGGIDAAEAVGIAQRLVATGMVDYVSVTAGNNTRKMARVDHWPPTPAPFGAFRHLSRAVRAGIDIPVATVGRVTTIELAEEILSAGDADLVGMVRAHVADPRLLPKARSGVARTIRPCIGANVCINALMNHESLTCMVNPEIGRPPETLDRPIYATRPAVVVGAGPAGLEAARRLALRGFRTTLIDGGDALGGQMRRWLDTPSRREFGRIIRWWGDELDRLGVGVRLGTEATVAELRALQPSVVLLATGSTTLVAPVAAAGPIPNYGPYDAPAAGGHVLVYDEMGRLPAMLTAERLAQTWTKVTLVTSMLHPGEGEGLTTAYSLLRALASRGIDIVDRAKVVRIEGRDAILEGVFGERRAPVRALDAVVSLTGAVSRTDLFDPLRAARIDVRLIGDAKLPRGITEAVQDAATTVWSLDDGRNEAGPSDGDGAQPPSCCALECALKHPRIDGANAMQSTARLVVVGGGCVGTGVLYGLAKRGWSDCLLLERRTLGSASTRLAGGFIPTYVRHNALSRLINKTIEIYAGLEAETGLSVGMHRNGQMRIARSADRLDEYRSYMNTAEAIGANAALLSPSETRDLWPLMRDSNGVFGALYHPDDAYVGPTDVTMAMAKGARDRGARIAQNTQALGFAQMPGGEWKVATTAGDVICEHIVLATGNYARQTGAMLGLDVPAIPLVVQYWFTDAIPEIVERKRQGLPEMPIVRDEAYLGYTREEGDGLMFGSYERPDHLQLFGVDGVPDSYDGEMLPADLDAHAWAFEAACDLVPPLARAGIRANIRGPMQMTADGLPLVGPAAGLRNVWLAEGVPGGILWGGTIGHSLSEWIVEGATSTDLTALDPRRFGDYATKEWTKRKVVETWGSHSDCVIPGTEMPAGRPAKTAPSYDRLDALGALWGVRNGWETPNWYAPAGTPRQDEMTYRTSRSGPHVAAEVRAVRENVGLIELTALAKFEVSGSGAAVFLDGLLADRLPVVGRVAEAHHLFEAGGVRARYAVTRLAHDLFTLISDAQAETLQFDTLRRVLPADGGVVLRNVTMERGIFTVAGPKARAVLEAAAGRDLSDAALPRGGVAVGSIGLAPDVRILRSGTTGELSYELHHSIAYQRTLLDAILQAGAAHGLKLVGTRALASLERDKSHRTWPAELASDISALECGLEPCFDKGTFPGKAALLAQQAHGLERKLVTLLLAADGLSPMGDEGVYKDGSLVGRITSAGWSFHLGQAVALALLPIALTPPGTVLTVPVLDTSCAATVVPDSPYDPDHLRTRM